MIEFDESESRQALEQIFVMVKGDLPMRAEDASARDIVALVRDALGRRDRHIADLMISVASREATNVTR